MDNRALLKRLNKAIGAPVFPECEDLSDALIQIYGADGCRETELSSIPDEYGLTGIPQLLIMLFDVRTTPGTSAAIRDYFATYDAHGKKLLRGHLKRFARAFKKPEAQKTIADLMQVIKE